MSSGEVGNKSSPKAAYEQRRLSIIAKRWDAKAAAWDRELQDPSCHLNEDDAYGRFLEQLALVLQHEREFCARHGVIDAGCGTGLVLEKIISCFAWGIGVDLSPQMIKAAAAKKIPNAKFVQGDSFDLSPICPKAGAIVSRGVLLSHYGHKHGEALLRSAHSNLISRGFIFFDFLNKDGRAHYEHAARDKTYFEAKEICAIASRAGFNHTTIAGEPDRRVRLLFARRD